VQVDQAVEVQVDSFPDQVFAGRVASIASEAEFTPRNVQTEEERVNMVFAVKVVIPNPDHVLKPGMPADAVILTQPTGGEG
jgi:multidrug efflux pump subunit AcrA (membrane-fusion protein)